jgi:hypothetical protein
VPLNEPVIREHTQVIRAPEVLHLVNTRSRGTSGAIM